MGQPQYPYVEFLILADRAEVHAGKLYMMGGSWDRITFPGFPSGYPTSLAIRIVLPPDDEADHVLDFAIRGPGEPQLDPHGIRFERQGAGPPGMPVPVLIGFPTMLVLTEPGLFTITAKIDGVEAKDIQLLAELIPNL